MYDAEPERLQGGGGANAGRVRASAGRVWCLSAVDLENGAKRTPEEAGDVGRAGRLEQVDAGILLVPSADHLRVEEGGGLSFRCADRCAAGSDLRRALLANVRSRGAARSPALPPTPAACTADAEWIRQPRSGTSCRGSHVSRARSVTHRAKLARSAPTHRSRSTGHAVRLMRTNPVDRARTCGGTRTSSEAGGGTELRPWSHRPAAPESSASSPASRRAARRRSSSSTVSVVAYTAGRMRDHPAPVARR